MIYIIITFILLIASLFLEGFYKFLMWLLVAIPFVAYPFYSKYGNYDEMPSFTSFGLSIYILYGIIVAAGAFLIITVPLIVSTVKKRKKNTVVESDSLDLSKFKEG